MRVPDQRFEQLLHEMLKKMIRGWKLKEPG